MVLCPLVALVLGKPGSNLTSLGGGHPASWCLRPFFLGQMSASREAVSACPPASEPSGRRCQTGRLLPHSTRSFVHRGPSPRGTLPQRGLGPLSPLSRLFCNSSAVAGEQWTVVACWNAGWPDLVWIIPGALSQGFWLRDLYLKPGLK